MRPLRRKLLRDLWAAKGQALAIVLLIACATAANLASIWTLDSLRQTQRAYYERYRFADLFAELRRAPDALLERVRQIPGISEAEGRVVALGSVRIEGYDEPVSGLLVSVPAGAQPALNRLYLRSGRLPQQPDEALVSEGLAKAHGLGPGNSVQMVLRGRLERVRLTGVALSPEHTYAIRPGDLMPDDLHFGVFWMPRDALEAAFDLDGAFDNLVARLSPGASEREALAALDRLLAPYGNLESYGRDRQISHRFVSNELTQLRTTAIVLPALFLGVAAFLLSVVLARLVAVQRPQIGTLKALGRSNAEIGAHYAGFAALIVLAGLVLGTGLGLLLGHAMTRLYVRYYRFPMLLLVLTPAPLAVAALMAFGSAALGVGRALVRAVRLPPAEAMRPEPPASYRATLLERAGLGRLLSPPGRMVLRSLSRRPGRSALGILGIAAGVALVVSGNFSSDALVFLVHHQFERVQREDLTVSFTDPEPIRALLELESLPGVQLAEPYRVVPIALRAGPRFRRTELWGLVPEPRLRRVVDADGRVRELPPEGLVISAELGTLLGVAPGDTLQVEVLEGSRPVREVRVAGLVDDLLGISAYLQLEELNRLLDEGRVVSGAFLDVDPGAQGSLYRVLRDRPGVAGVAVRSTAVQSFRRVMNESFGYFVVILALLAGTIAVGVVYNSARIALAERDRELATLRVIGFTRLEAFRIVLEELAVQVLLAIPIGFLLGWFFATLLSRSLATELFRLPAVLEPSSYGAAALLVLATLAAVALVVWRWMGRLDLVAVLKTRE